MSFGFGVGDFIKVIELAKKTCDACKAAPTDFAEAAQSLDNLTVTLNSVKSEYEKPESLLRRDERNAFEIAKLGNGCLATLQRLEHIIVKYKSLGENRPKALDRFRFPRKEVLEIKGRLALYCTNFSVFLQTVGVSSLGRIENYATGTDRELARILEAVDRLGAEIRTGGPLSSVLSDHSNDEKRVWKDFRTRLVKDENITSEAITQHSDAIIARIKDLVEFGLLESDTASDFSPDFESINSPVRPIVRDNYRPPEVMSDIESDRDSAIAPVKTRAKKSFHGYRSLDRRLSDDDDASDCTVTPTGPTANLARVVTGNGINDTSSTSNRGSRTSMSTSRSPPEPSCRLWQGRDGTLNVEAKILEKTASFAILQDASGKPFLIAMNELSADDLRYLQLVSPEPSTTIHDDGRTPFRAPTVRIPSINPILRGRRTLGRQLPPWKYRMDSLLPSGYTKGSITSDFLPSAAAKGDTRLVLRGLAAGEHIESRGPTGTEDVSQPETTALFRAVDGGHFETAQVLLEHGANPCNARPSKGIPLCRAATRGDLELVRLLLEYGARPEMKSWGFSDPRTALHIAADSGHYRMTKLLLEYKADLDIRDDLHITPLHLASRGGHLSIVKLLLEQGAFPNAMSLEGQTPLYKAAGAGDCDTVGLLIQFGADVRVGHGKSGESTLYKVTWKGYDDIARTLLQNQADIDCPNRLVDTRTSPFDFNRMYATRTSFFKGLIGMLDGGRDQDQRSQPHRGRYPIHAAAATGCKRMIKLLLEYHPDLAVQDGEGALPLDLALEAGHDEIAEILIRAGAPQSSKSVRRNRKTSSPSKRRESFWNTALREMVGAEDWR